MKTILAATLTVGAVLGILWGIMTHQPQQALAQPNVNDTLIITQSYGLVEGFAIPQAEVIFSDTKGNTTSTIADKTGKFSLNISKELPLHNGTISIRQKINGVTGPTHTFTVGWMMSISKCTATELTVSGKPNTDIQIRIGKETMLSQGKTDNNGNYTANISNVPVGSDLTIIQMNGGIEFHKSYKLPPVPPKFTVTESTLAGIKGIGLPRGIIREHQGIYGYYTSDNGTFLIGFPLYSGQPALGSKLYYYQLKDNRSGPAQEVLVGWSQHVNPVTEATSDLTGTGKPNTQTRVQTENGQLLGQGTSGSNGQYAINITKQKANTKLQVIQTIAGTDYMSTISVEKNSYTVSPFPFQLGNTAVTGTYAGTNLDAITKVVLLVDGVVVKNGAFNPATKTFQIYAGGLITTLQQKVEVALFHGNTELKRAPVSVTGTYNLSPSPYQLGNASVTGTYAGTDLTTITKVVLLVDGVIVKNGALNTSAKTFQVYASGLITNLQQKVEVALFSGNTELKRTQVFVGGKYNLIPSPFQLGNTTVSGSYSGTGLEAITKAVLLVDGVVVKNGALDPATQTFQIYAGGLVTSTNQKVEVALFNGTVELKRAPVTVSVKKEYSLTASPYQMGSPSVTGSYSGTDLSAITKVVLLVNGTVVKNGALNTTAKTFQIYASGLVTNANQKVEVALFSGNTELKRVLVTVK
ncbi:immunoglobulin-like domain-containing protein [Listeria grandensis]|uniref:immunoglobulin-like domain-containing protein n=1 Tax=Listeria grandensis TaxID=1494963 RepID=UPI00164E1A2E|nr:immunoglobulin-like domain-containing protein [Listeria grandensis]MBC6316682.1 hypothetical protein [Listeria grandensis]